MIRLILFLLTLFPLSVLFAQKSTYPLQWISSTSIRNQDAQPAIQDANTLLIGAGNWNGIQSAYKVEIGYGIPIHSIVLHSNLAFSSFGPLHQTKVQTGVSIPINAKMLLGTSIGLEESSTLEFGQMHRNPWIGVGLLWNEQMHWGTSLQLKKVHSIAGEFWVHDVRIGFHEELNDFIYWGLQLRTTSLYNLQLGGLICLHKGSVH